MKLRKIAILALAAALLLAACRSEPPDEYIEPTAAPVDAPDEVPVPLEPYIFTQDNFPRMDGSPAAAPLAEALAAVMLGQSCEDVKDRVMFTNTAQSYRSLAGGQCDIIIAGEPYPPVLGEISRQDFRHAMAPIALDALVFVVSASNPVDNLTSEQVRAIYAGEITRWQQVGGMDCEIIAFQRNEEALSQVLTEKLVMDWDEMADAPMQAIQGRFPQDPQEGDMPPTVIKGFDGSVNAIGYTMHHYAVNMGMASGCKILSIDGIKPSSDTISGGEYPFISPYYALINRDLPEDDNARILYNWLISEAGQAFITSIGYVSISGSSLGGSLQNDGAQATEQPQIRWEVATNDSRLTPYEPQRSNFTRLYDAALPELTPFNGYGMLLPYGAAVTTNDGGIHTVKYGLVAAHSGTVVMDPVYDNISRAMSYAQTGDVPVPAYHLQINLPPDDPDSAFRTIQSACAVDGSWITPASYRYDSIEFREDVMFCRYDYYGGTFNIDVYDYNGNLLYNILEMEWADRISEETGPEMLIYNEGEGYSFIVIDDGVNAMVDIMSGEITETEFAGTYSFFDGLVAVQLEAGGLWGFADKDLELVIPAQYVREAAFINGQAIVETPDGEQHVINKDGEALFTVEPGSLIMINEAPGYTVFNFGSEEQTFPVFYTFDFTPIPYPPEALPLGAETVIRHIRDGWFMCMTEHGVWLFSSRLSYHLPNIESVYNVADFIDGYILFTQHDNETGAMPAGVMLPDGTVIIPPVAGTTIAPILADGALAYFALNTMPASSFLGVPIGDSYIQSRYSIVDLNGQTLKSDLGTLAYDSVGGYAYVQGADYFALLDENAAPYISIPSMAYTFD